MDRSRWAKIFSQPTRSFFIVVLFQNITFNSFQRVSGAGETLAETIVRRIIEMIGFGSRIVSAKRFVRTGSAWIDVSEYFLVAIAVSAVSETIFCIKMVVVCLPHFIKRNQGGQQRFGGANGSDFCLEHITIGTVKRLCAQIGVVDERIEITVYRCGTATGAIFYHLIDPVDGRISRGM